jgi:hypothetical protein
VLIFSFSGLPHCSIWGVGVFSLIKPVQNGNHSVDFFFTDQIFLEQFVQEPVRRQFFHFDGVLDNAAWCFEGETGVSLVD